jgi:hypothetical protein
VETPQPETVADGKDHQLDPRAIAMSRIAGWISTATLALALPVPLFIVWRAVDDLPRVAGVLFALSWAGVTAVNAWIAQVWPVYQYRHTRYSIDALGIEIRRGVVFRTVVNVPKSRVQHTDVSQGPVERHFGLGTLVIYTAGTDHSRVTLSGLEHGRAMRIREHLLPSEAGDAV